MAIALLVLFACALLLFGSDSAPASEPERIIVVVPSQPQITGGSGGILIVLVLALIVALMVVGQ